MSRNIERNPYARETLVRKIEYTENGCKECGQKKATRTGKKFLYNYGVDYDSYRKKTAWDDYNFCSISCRRIYYS